MEVVSSLTSELVCHLIIIINTSADNLTRGSYMHPLVAIEYIRWLSPTFAVYANAIVLEYGAREMRVENTRLNREITEKNGTILTLEEKLQLMEARIKDNMKSVANEVEMRVKQESVAVINEIKASREEVVAELSDVKDELAEAQVSNIYLEKSVTDLTAKIDNIVVSVKTNLTNKVVPPIENDEGDELFVLFKKYDENALYPYYIICRKIDDAHAYIRRNRNIKAERRVMIDIYSTSSPNSKNLLNHIKNDEYLRGSIIDKRKKNVVAKEQPKISWCRNDFKIIDDRITEQELIDAIKRLEAIREDVVADTVSDGSDADN